jgi:hypothetical protein
VALNPSGTTSSVVAATLQGQGYNPKITFIFSNEKRYSIIYRFEHIATSECFVIVNIMNLFKTFHHQSCLINVNISILVRLFLENSFTTDRSHTINCINQILNFIVMHGFYFGFHGCKSFLRVGPHHCFCVSYKFVIVQQ